MTHMEDLANMVQLGNSIPLLPSWTMLAKSSKAPIFNLQKNNYHNNIV